MGVSMGIIDEVLKVLDRIPIWKRLQEVPSEVDDLRSRIAALEELVSGKALADACPFCGKRAFRLDRSIMHGRAEIWTCQECKKSREKRLDLSPHRGQR